MRYPLNYLHLLAQEKGIDVELSIDVVAGAIDRTYDVGIVFSRDSDIRPAIELVVNRFVQLPRLELASWSSPTSTRPIPVRAQRNVWCHSPDQLDNVAVADPTDYAK
ncbi:MAG: NYN domain-containing protein [Chloroflexi bacterium]|nr:NYN domain-containing protein [Chloroflexota bacterium]